MDVLLKRDPHLTDHQVLSFLSSKYIFFNQQKEIRRRYGQFEDILKAMEEQDGGIENFALGHKTFGPQVDGRDNQIVVTIK